nr:hypothetical protein [Tanacetum cinerariifolium]
MTTLAKFMILSGGDNRPPILNKDLYDSWKSRMELYMQNKEHGRMILESVEHGLLIWPTIEENGVTRTKKYEELFATKKIQADCDLKATNIILQGQPSDVYSPVNHHRVANDLWERVQLLMQVHQDACPQPQSISQIEYTVSIVNQQTHLAEFPQIDSGLVVPMFKQGDDPIDSINKMMSFMSTVGDCLTGSGRQSSFAAGISEIRANISGTRGNNSGQQRVVKCFNCQGEGHMARQCLKLKRKKDDTWFRDKVLLVKAQGSDKVLNEEELAFLADTRVAKAKAVLMANLSSYRSDFLFKVPHSKNTHNDMLNQSVHEISYFEQTHLVNYSENEITNNSNIIPYSQYLLETQNAAVRDINSFAQQDVMILSMFEQLSNQEKETLKSTFNVLKNESKEKEVKNIDKEIALEKKVKELDNIVNKMGQSAQTIRPMLDDGTVIAKETNMISIADSEETLMLEEDSRSKMLLKSYPMVLEKKVNIKLINYVELNRLSKDFGKHFVPQQELSDEQAFWLQTSHPNIDQCASSLVKIKAHWELPKVSLVNTSLKKLKYHLGPFDTVVKNGLHPML